MKNSNIISGLWKFSHKISEEKLIELAQEWSLNKKYIQLYIRKVSKDQNGIGFMYDITDSDNHKQEYDEYFDKTSDTLKRNFGNDLAGWDLSSSTIIIK